MKFTWSMCLPEISLPILSPLASPSTSRKIVMHGIHFTCRWSTPTSMRAEWRRRETISPHWLRHWGLSWGREWAWDLEATLSRLPHDKRLGNILSTRSRNVAAFSIHVLLCVSLFLFYSTGKWVISGSGVDNSVWQANSPKEFIKWDLKIRKTERGLRWRRLCKLVELYSSALCALKILINFTQIEKSLTGIYKSIILIFITANSRSLSLYCLSSLSVRLPVRSSVCLSVYLFNQLDLRVCKSYGFQIRW